MMLTRGPSHHQCLLCSLITVEQYTVKSQTHTSYLKRGCKMISCVSVCYSTVLCFGLQTSQYQTICEWVLVGVCHTGFSIQNMPTKYFYYLTKKECFYITYTSAYRNILKCNNSCCVFLQYFLSIIITYNKTNIESYNKNSQCLYSCQTLVSLLSLVFLSWFYVESGM